MQKLSEVTGCSGHTPKHELPHDAESFEQKPVPGPATAAPFAIISLTHAACLEITTRLETPPELFVLTVKCMLFLDERNRGVDVVGSVKSG